MEKIQIERIERDNYTAYIHFSVSNRIEEFFQKEKIFFVQYDFDISDVPDSVIVIPALVNLLPFSWLADCVIWVNEIDWDFYQSLPRLKIAFQELHHNYKLKGTLIAAKVVKNRLMFTNEAVQLFTGGVDATSTFIRIKDQKPILFNTNGWYIKNPSEKNNVYEADRADISKISNIFGVQANFVKSNFATFIDAERINKTFGKETKTTWWFGFQHSPAFIGCAMVTAYHFRARKVYIASSYTFGQYVVCVSDPRIDNCFTCAGIETIHEGYEYSRQNKVKQLVEYQKDHDCDMPIRVCSFNTHNCCKCEKCFRSMLALISEGAEDLSKYGFCYQGSLLDNLKNFIGTSGMELDSAHAVFWKDIILRMEENKESLHFLEVYDYLKDIDFQSVRKQAVWNHYRNDYKEIIKRKIRNISK